MPNDDFGGTPPERDGELHGRVERCCTVGRRADVCRRSLVGGNVAVRSDAHAAVSSVVSPSQGRPRVG